MGPRDGINSVVVKRMFAIDMNRTNHTVLTDIPIHILQVDLWF